MNAVVLLAMELAPHDADASANSIKWIENNVESHFNHLELKNTMQESFFCIRIRLAYE